jgi:predicted esterase
MPFQIDSVRIGQIVAVSLLAALVSDCRPVWSQPSDDIVLPELIPDAEFAQLFSELKLKSDAGKECRAFLFEPRSRRPNETYPLVIWLHGSGVIEFDEEFGPLKWIQELIMQDLDGVEKYRFFLLVPKLTRDEGRWFLLPPNEAEADDMLSVAEEFISKTVHEHAVDTDRVSVVGISSGGSAVWELAIRRPELFAAVVPISGACHGLDRIEELVSVPVWTFANEQDLPVVVSVRKAVAALKDAGGSACLTEPPRLGHDAWTDAFLGDHELLSWMTSKRKGDPSWYRPPGSRLSTWYWGLLASITPPIVVLVVLYAVFMASLQRTTAAPADAFEDSFRHVPDSDVVTARKSNRRTVLWVAIAVFLAGTVLYWLVTLLSAPAITQIR